MLATICLSLIGLSIVYLVIDGLLIKRSEERFERELLKPINSRYYWKEDENVFTIKLDNGKVTSYSQSCDWLIILGVNYLV